LNEETLDKKYLYHLLNSASVRLQIQTTASGTKVKHTSPDRIYDVLFNLPPLPEQRKIAAILSTWDEAIALTEQLIGALQRRKQALMQVLLTGRVRFAEFEGGEWETGEFIEFLKLQRGFDLSVGERKPGIYKVIASNGVVGYHDQAMVQGPGVTTGRSGTLGKVIYEENDFWPLNTTLFVSEFNGNDPLFAYYFLQHFRIERFGTGTGVPTLNRNDVHPIEISYPNINEQRQIAEFMRLCDEEIELCAEHLAWIRRQKRGLMQQLLTGAVRVEVEEDNA
jgi:type I restriction enzyme S subunit